ncbi:M91 family zinc metallopeptidase [Oceanibaculum nanhaiense]|uniref:M91 family zinc metallopeptidase n=1 Tax=Oceanibaculum nanhaiense TaxID=1909734 RepID=UPI000A3C37F4|nr:M91 family zinc metallopeptidase [Oceanibaculum nanhaiense]
MLRMLSRTGRPGVLQRQINAPGGFAALNGQSQSLTAIVGLVTRYNRFCARIPTYQRLQMLSQIRDSLHRWLVTNIQHMDRDILLDLLDQVRAEHQRIIATTGATDQIYALNDGNGEAQQLWGMLVGGQGRVIIDATDYGRLIQTGVRQTVPNFRARMLSSLAVLLETPEGRKLIRKLLNSPQTVRLVPLTPRTQQALTLMQQQVALNRQTQPGARGFQVGNPPILPPPVHGGNSPGLTFADPVPFIRQNGFDVNAYIGAVVGARANMDLNGGTLPPLNGGVPQGSAAIVAIDPNLDDSGAFAVNATTGQPLTTPLFLTLAHELLHAKRIMRGRSRSGPAPIPAFNNAEEYRTIAGPNSSENRFRTAYGLGTRFGHGGGLRNQLALPQGHQLVLYQPPPQVPQQMALVPYQAPGNGQMVPYVAPPQGPQQMALVPYQPQNLALVPYRPPAARLPLAIMPPPQLPMIGWH